MSELGTGINFAAGFSSTVSPKLKNVISLLRPIKPSDPLPPNFEPGPKDVCSGRGKRNWNHAGNIAFRNMIQSNVESYINAPNKNEKTAIVCTIVDDMRRDGYRFLQQNQQGLWFDIGDAKARDKVGHSLRDQVTAINKGQATLKPSNEPLAQGLSTLKAPLKNNWNGNTLMKQMQELYEDEHMMALSDNEAEAEESYRRRSVTSQEIEKFARRPSWIAGEVSSSSESMEGISAMELERRRSSALSLFGLAERTLIQDLMDMDASGSHLTADHAQSHTGVALPQNVTSIGPTGNEYGYNDQHQHTVAALPPTMVSAQDWSLQFQHQPTQGERNVDPLQQHHPHDDGNPTSHLATSGAAQWNSSQNDWAALPTTLVSTESQMNRLMEEDTHQYGEDPEAAHSSKQSRLPNRRIAGDSQNVLMDSIKSWDPRTSQNSVIGSAHMSDIANSGSSFPDPLGAQRSSRRFSGARLRRATNIIRFSGLSIASDLLEGFDDWSKSEDGINYEEI